MRTLATSVVCLFLCVPTYAAVSSSGDVQPSLNSEDNTTLNGSLTVGEGLANGNTTIGTMTVEAGTQVVSGDGIVGNRLGSNGTVVIRDEGSEWAANDDMFVGNDGYGDVFVSDRGILSAADDFSIGVLDDGRGWVSIANPASLMATNDILTVGLAGTGSLHAADFARVVSNSGVIGSDANSTGFVTVQEQASWRMSQDLTVSASGIGTLVIADGGLVENNIGRITTTNAGNGTVTVTGQNSLWLNRDDLIIADRGSGTLNIEDVGLVQVRDTLINNRSGRVVMDEGNLSAASISNNGVIEGSGRIRGAIANRPTGSVRSGDSGDVLVLISPFTNDGSVDTIGGSIEFQSPVVNAETAPGIFSRDGELRFRQGLTNNGKMGFTAGAADVFGNVTNSASGTIEVDGEGVVTFYDRVTSTGTITVGTESSAAFLGDLLLAAPASLSFTGLGVEPLPEDRLSTVDPLTVAGRFELDGSLDLVGSDDPTKLSEPIEAGDSIVLSLVSADEIIGSFDAVTYDGAPLSMDTLLDGGPNFRSYDEMSEQLGMFRTLTYTSTSLDLTNYAAIAGDTDGDRDVDFTDFLVVARNFGKEGDWRQGDFTGDGFVQFNDFLDLARNFGVVVAAAASLEPVPEPTGLVLLGLGIATFGLGRKRRRS